MSGQLRTQQQTAVHEHIGLCVSSTSQAHDTHGKVNKKEEAIDIPSGNVEHNHKQKLPLLSPPSSPSKGTSVQRQGRAASSCAAGSHWPVQSAGSNPIPRSKLPEKNDFLPQFVCSYVPGPDIWGK